jgi:hypothetical protein
MKEAERSGTSKSYMWVFTSGTKSDKPIRIFEYRTGRAGKNAEDFLIDYDEYLHTDAYQGYGTLKKVKRCLCWSHARRYFVDAMPKTRRVQKPPFLKRELPFATNCLRLKNN